MPYMSDSILYSPWWCSGCRSRADFERQFGLVPGEEKEENQKKDDNKPTETHLQLLPMRRETLPHIKNEEERPNLSRPPTPSSLPPPKQKSAEERRREQSLAKAKEFQTFLKQEKRFPSRKGKSSHEKTLANWLGKQKYLERMGTRASNEEVDRILIEVLYFILYRQVNKWSLKVTWLFLFDTRAVLRSQLVKGGS